MPIEVRHLTHCYSAGTPLSTVALDDISFRIDDGEFIPYEKGLIDLLFFQRNHRGAHTRRDTTRA